MFGLFNFFKKSSKTKKITSSRIRGRWYGLMLILGDESGLATDLSKKDKAAEIIMMLEISNKFPEEFKIVKDLMALEDKLKKGEGSLSTEKAQRDYILGALEAKRIRLQDRPWTDLKILDDIK